MKPTAPLALLLTAFVAPTAQAAPFLTLVDPGLLTDDFVACVEATGPEDAQNPASCETAADIPEFMRFLTRGMTEQSYTLQGLSLQGSALVPGPSGPAAGLQLKTFPFAEVTNLVGKEENTSFSPILPALELTYVGQAGATHWGFGASGVPPLPVGGASARVLSAGGSVGWDLGAVRVGAEVDATLGVVRAPVVATPAQYEAGELNNTPEGRYEEVCAPQAHGCLDTLSLAHVNARVGAVWQASDAVQPYLKVGVVRLDESFDVQVDLSSWRLKATLPTATLGVSLPVHERLRAAVGASAAWRPDSLYEAGGPLLYRLEGGVSWAL